LVATRHFTFDLTGALAEQLDAALPTLTPEPLSSSQLQSVDPVPGIYQLYLSGDLVYVGKADRSLRARLTDHHRKIIGRLNIDIANMTFTGLYLEGTWIPVGPEQMLIKKRELQGLKPPWNINGFGINDPGKERDTTNFGLDHFDVLYPADLNYSISTVSQGTSLVSELLPIVKRELPYIFRYENQWARHPDYLESDVTLPKSAPTAREVFEALMTALPSGWQITVLPGYVIMYKSVRSYPGSRDVFRSLDIASLSGRDGILTLSKPVSSWRLAARLVAHLLRSRTASRIIAAAVMGSSCSQILITCQPASRRRLSVSASRVLFPSILVVQKSEFFCEGL
jgi:hypothetical protein